MKKASLLTLMTALAFGPSALAFAQGHEHGPRVFEQIDTNADGQLSRDELHADVQKRFAEYDLDKNGKITLAEVQKVSADKMSTRQEHSAEHLAAADKNHDGKWSKDELSKMPEGMFKKLDTNSDGFLTKAELDAGREGWQEHHGDFAEHLFSKIDTNGDGSVDITEALSFADTRFTTLDSNHDGVVSKDEWKAGHPGLAHRAEHRMDSNHG